MSSEEDTYNIIFQALKHPVRRRILRRLDAGPATFTGLLNELGIDNGLLNYHLNNLGELVAKGPDERYRLSEFGAATLSLTRRVEEPVRPGEGVLRILGHRMPVSRVLAVAVVLLLSTNVYLAYSLRGLSNDQANALGWTLMQARGCHLEAVNVLNATLDTGTLEMGALNVLYGDMAQASRLLRVASILDGRHRGQWEALRQASDSLAQASQQIMSRMASSGESEAEISFGQRLHLERVSASLARMGGAFPDKLVLGSSPMIAYDEGRVTDAVAAAAEFDGALNGLYSAFNLGRPFTLELADGYIWIEDS